MIIGFARIHLTENGYNVRYFLQGGSLSSFNILAFQLTIIGFLVPTLLGIAGAILLLLRSDRRKLIGAGITLTALAAYINTDVLWVGILWDGMHSIYGYTHASWIVSSYAGTPIAFYYVYIPLMALTVVFLFKGWKKLKQESRTKLELP